MREREPKWARAKAERRNATKARKVGKLYVTQWTTELVVTASNGGQHKRDAHHQALLEHPEARKEEVAFKRLKFQQELDERRRDEQGRRNERQHVLKI